MCVCACFVGHTKLCMTKSAYKEEVVEKVRRFCVCLIDELTEFSMDSCFGSNCFFFFF